MARAGVPIGVTALSVPTAHQDRPPESHTATVRLAARKLVESLGWIVDDCDETLTRSSLAESPRFVIAFIDRKNEARVRPKA